MTFYKGNTIVNVTRQQEQAYKALKKAATRIGANNYANGTYSVKRHKKTKKVLRGYHITQAHREVIEAMPKVLSGEMTPNEAMALLHRDDVFQQRTN